MNEQTIAEIEAELKRFNKRLKALKERIKNGDSYLWHGCKETAALKRSGLDLRNELVKLNKGSY